jgi:hypothetical protein
VTNAQSFAASGVYCDAVMLILPRDNSSSSQPQRPIARFIRGARERHYCA